MYGSSSVRSCDSTTVIPGDRGTQGTVPSVVECDAQSIFSPRARAAGRGANLRSSRDA